MPATLARVRTAKAFLHSVHQTDITLSQGYVDKLNAAIADANGALDGMSLTEVVQAVGTAAVPESVATKVQQNGGGHWNHSLFWKIMKPPLADVTVPNGNLAKAICDEFGSYDTFKVINDISCFSKIQGHFCQ